MRGPASYEEKLLIFLLLVLCLAIPFKQRMRSPGSRRGHVKKTQYKSEKVGRLER